MIGECHEQQDAAGEPADDGGIGPAHVVVFIWVNAGGDGDQNGAQAEREGDVAPPIDGNSLLVSGVAQFAIRPDRAEDADRHVEPEHRAPVDGREQAARHQADELAGQGCDLIEAERQTALVVRKRVGEDRDRLRGEHRAAQRLKQTPADQPQRAAFAIERIERQQHRRDREDREARVVDPDAAEHVAHAAQRHDEYRLHEQIAHDHPQQVADVAGRERIEMDAAEDGGQRDDDDRAVERGHEHGERRVRQGHPLITVVGHQQLSLPCYDETYQVAAKWGIKSGLIWV